MCVCLLFFCLLSAEKLLTGDEKHRKKHVVSSLWYTDALQFVRVHACITLKESAGRTASMTHKTCEHKTKKNTTAEVHVSQ